MYGQIVEILISLVLCLLAILYTGNFIISYIKVSALFVGYYALLIGSVFFVLVASVFLSGFQTVMLGFIIIFFFLFDKKHPTKWSNYKDVLHITIVSIVFACLQLITIYNGKDLPLLPEGDALYYARLADLMASTGIENTNLQVKGTGCEPYHYFDIWIAATIIKITNLHPYFVLKCIVYPILLTILYFGFYLWAKKEGMLPYKAMALAFIMCFFSGFYISTFENISIINQSVLFFYSAITYPKLLIVYIFIQAALISYINQNAYQAVVFTACLPICFITMMPVFVAFTALLAIAICMRKRNIHYKYFGPPLGVIVFILIFYLLQPTSTTVNIDKLNSIEHFFKMQHYTTAVNIVGATVIQFCIAYLIWIIIAFYLLVNFAYTEIVILIKVWMLIFLLALMAWALLNQIMDSVQLFFNLIIPATSIICFFLIIKLYHFRLYIPLTCVVALLCFRTIQFFTINASKSNPYSPSYITYVTNNINKDSFVAASILSAESYKRIFAKNTQFRVNDAYLYYLNADYKCQAISVMDGHNVDGNKPLENLFLKQSAFYQFIQNQKRNGKFISIEQSQVDFIKHEEINLVFISKGGKPSAMLSALADTSITDTGTGETVLKLNY